MKVSSFSTCICNFLYVQMLPWLLHCRSMRLTIGSHCKRLHPVCPGVHHTVFSSHAAAPHHCITIVASVELLNRVKQTARCPMKCNMGTDWCVVWCVAWSVKRSAAWIARFPLNVSRMPMGPSAVCSSLTWNVGKPQ